MKLDSKTLSEVQYWMTEIFKTHSASSAFFEVRAKIRVALLEHRRDNLEPGAYTLDELKPDMMVFYKLVQGKKITYLPVQVISAGPKRVYVQDVWKNRYGLTRIVKPERLFRKDPTDANF